jgi:hypothetical protein
MAGFWLMRKIQQFVFSRFHNRFVHLLTMVFIAGVLLFTLPWFIKM